MLAIILLALLAVSSAEDRIYNGKEGERDLNNVIYIRSPKGGGCTGTVVSEHYVLTAAHCFKKNPNFVVVFPREMFRESNPLTPPYMSEQWTVHPDFKNTSTGDDIALIKVSKPMGIPAVPLPATYSHPKDDWLRVAGYGKTNYTIINATHADFTDPATALMETYLQGADEKDCFNASYLEERPHLNVICVGNSNSSLLKGDSGGPVFAQGKDDKWYQVGVTSFGVLSPAIHPEVSWSLALQQPFDILTAVTDVSHYCPWIEETTGGEVKCQTFDPIKIVPKF